MKQSALQSLAAHAQGIGVGLAAANLVAYFYGGTPVVTLAAAIFIVCGFLLDGARKTQRVAQQEADGE